MKRYFLVIAILSFMAITSVSWGVSLTADYAVFLQKDGELETLYVAEIGNPKPHLVASDKGLNVFIEKQQLLYFHDKQLYRYDPLIQESRLLTKFKESEIELQVLPGTPGQALVSARTDYYEINWYVLELNDGSLRRVTSPNNSGSGGESKTIKDTSPDELSQVILKANSKNRFSMAVQRRLKGRFSDLWSLPQDMTVMPELPVWAPNSRLIAFYAKPNNNLSGYYSLYCLDLDKLELTKVQEQVFARLFTESLLMAGFRPDWSPDSQTLIFQYQPYGSPTQSVIMSYKVKSAKKEILVKGPGLNEYPQISSSGRYLLFLSDRDGIQHQLYTMDIKGEKLERISSTGKTEWGAWYQP